MERQGRRIVMRTWLRFVALGLLAVAVGALLLAARSQGDAQGWTRASCVPPVLSIEENGLRYTFHVTSGSEALFDLQSDPGQRQNLLPDRAEDARRLRKRLESELDVRSLEEFREFHREEIEQLRGLGYL
jgi:hypothetical protein